MIMKEQKQLISKRVETFPISYRQCQHCHFQAHRFYEGTPLLGRYWQLCEKCAKNLGDNSQQALLLKMVGAHSQQQKE